ncbi:MAG: ABC transporter ATP-binding protein, partial [Desulfobacterales bacterium]|nr:ABC transporter ATP-binding protein [Desulfobacterales bacterium]
MGFEMKDATFFYEEKKVIDDFSAVFEPGKLHGVMGPNGSGKTTVLDLLIGHIRPASGKVEYKGRSVSSYSRKALAKEVALTPQNFYINFPFTVKEIIMMGRYPHIPRFHAPSAEDVRIVEDVMARTGADEFRDRFITELSGGERQRVVFARSLAQDTPVLILDEATSNLDVNYAINLLNIAAGRVRDEGKTVIAVFQDINLAAAWCDELLLMKQGRMVRQGALADVLT